MGPCPTDKPGSPITGGGLGVISNALIMSSFAWFWRFRSLSGSGRPPSKSSGGGGGGGGSEARAPPGPWRVGFVDGGPALPAARSLDRLSSWTAWTGDTDALRAFAGTARYTTRLEKPTAAADGWRLSLGEVRHSARVRLDGRELATLVARPFDVELPPDAFRAGGNTLEIEVTNLLANRIADMERRGIAWRNYMFFDIRFQEFDASGWEPLASGLLGPVQLVPMASRKP